jgi:hypothetical protein
VPTSWHVQVFRLPSSKRTGLFGTKREFPGYGWSASGDPEGYRYSKGPFPDAESAEAAARKDLETGDSHVESVGVSAH